MWIFLSLAYKTLYKIGNKFEMLVLLSFGKLEKRLEKL